MLMVTRHIILLPSLLTIYFLHRKTTLVKQIFKPLKERNGYLITGKFDLMAEGDSVIFSAFDSFFDTLLKERGNENLKLLTRLRKHIMDVVGGYGVNVLTKSIPTLDRFFENSYSYHDKDHQGNAILQTRWQVLLCKLISAITDHMKIVLVLDDLQWACETSLDLFQMVATDPDIKHCLCVGCYRDDDHGLTRKVTGMFDCIKAHTSVMVINLGEARISVLS